MADIQSGGAGLKRDFLTARMNPLDWIALILLIVGGLNWAVLGVFGIDLVASVLGRMTTASRAVYVLVGVAALYSIYLCIKMMPKPAAGP